MDEMRKGLKRAARGFPASILFLLFLVRLLPSLSGQDEPDRARKILDGLLSPSLAGRVEAAWALSRLPEEPWKKRVRRLAETGAALSARVRDLVRRLGAERWADREEAEKPLFGLAACGALLSRGLDPAPWKGPVFLAPPLGHADPSLSKEPPPTWRLVLSTGETFEGEFLGMDGMGLRLRWMGRAVLRLPATLLSSAEPKEGEPSKKKGTPARGWVLFRSGSWFPGRILSLEGDQVEADLALLGRRTFPKGALLGWGRGVLPRAFPGLAPGGDRLTLEGGAILTCRVLGFRKDEIMVRLGKEKEETYPLQRVASLVMSGSKWEKKLFPGNPMQTLLAQSFKLWGGGEVKAFLLWSAAGTALLVDPFLGLLRITLDRVKLVRFHVGLGQAQGLTLVADLDESKVVEFNSDGKRIWSFKDLDGGPLDAEWLPDGNLLVCEEGGRVREVTREGKTVWEMKGLSLPYDADKLSNGNYLIADTGHKRVIEVTPAKKIVWTLTNVTPYDVQRLPNGNTLIADNSKDRVIEVDKKGRIVWSVERMPEVRDADRLPGGHTLIACWGNHSVIEVDRNGKVVWKVTDLETPSDADRLPGGLTLIAESGRVRVVDWQGRTVWSVPVGWAVEANRY